LLFGYLKADETRRRFHLMLWNIYNFFITYANIDKFDPTLKPPNLAVLDKWIKARLNETTRTVTQSLEKYDAYTASLSLEGFVSDLSLWYVRRSRDRLGPAASNIVDKKTCLATLYQVLVTLSQLLAPFTPFLSEELYRNLTDKESVHLSDWPEANKPSPLEKPLLEDMKFVRKIVELGLSKRKEAQIKVRQPLRQATVTAINTSLGKDFQQLILDELNIKNLVWEKSENFSIILDSNLDSELIAEGYLRDLIREVQEARKTAGARLDQKIKLTAPVPDNPRLVSELKVKTLAEEIIPGDSVSVQLI
jgi:isoleucyl-tRNA synthetase